MTARRPTLAAARRACRGWWGIVIGSLALAGISMIGLRGSIAYDPYSWLVWGREIVHLDLNTRRGATAVKPLPMALDTVFAFAGSAEPNVWLFFARAGTVVALAGTGRLAWRLRGWLAAVVAVAALVVSDQMLGYLFMRGMSEPMAAATMVAAVDAFLLRRRRWAIGCLVAAAYLRPEAWPILLVYLVWQAWPHGWVRRGVAAAVGIFVPFSWFLFDYFGARQFLRSANAATHTSQGGPLLSHNPGLATFSETWRLASGPVVVLFVVGLVVVVRSWWRGGHPVRPLELAPEGVLCLVVVVWLVVDAVLAQGRFATGAPRYLLPAEALACVVVGLGVVAVTGWLVRRVPGGPRPAVGAMLAAVVAVAVLAPWLDRAGRQFDSGVTEGRQFADLARRLPAAIRLAGGPDAVLRCGPVVTRNFQVPLVAWQLDVPIGLVGIRPGATGTVIQQGNVPPVPAALRSRYTHVGDVGAGGPPAAAWEVFTTCGP